MPEQDAPQRHSLVGSAWRFLIAGGANTLITAGLLALLSLVIDPRIAYTIVFAGGVVLSTVLADRYVYGVRMNRAAVVAYVALYLVVYLVGLLAVHLWTSAGYPEAATSLVVVITAPLTFIGGRIITGRLHRARTTEAPAPAHQENP
jgi:putative flippase GtrA